MRVKQKIKKKYLYINFKLNLKIIQKCYIEFLGIQTTNMSETEKNLLADLINDRKNNSENIIEGKNTNSNNSIGKKTNNPLKKIHDQSKNNSQNNISNFKLNDTNIKLKFVTNNNNIDSGINNLKINEKNLIKEEREKHKKYSFDESAIDIFEDLKNYEDSLTENLNECF